MSAAFQRDLNQRVTAMIFRLFAIATLIGIGPTLFAGCDPPPAPVANTPPAPPPPPPPASVSTGSEVASPAAGPKSPVPLADFQVTPSNDSSRSAQLEQLPIHLSVGVAVPQLLPEGTQIGVSVEYAITGRLNSSQYHLVIESSAGHCALPVNLSPMRGTLQDFLPPSVRPEHKPFKARIEEKPSKGHSVPVSNTVALQTSY